MTELMDKEKDTQPIPVPTDEDDIRQYLREIRQIPRLTVEEERELARRCAQGDEEAIRKMASLTGPQDPAGAQGRHPVRL